MSRRTLQKNLSYDDVRNLFYVTYTQDGRRKTRTFPSYAQALDFLGNPGDIPKASITLDQWLHWWMTMEVEPHRAKSTSYGYRNIISLHLAPSLGPVPLSDLSPLQIQSYFSTLLQQGLSPNTVRKHDTLLRTALKRAVDLRLLTDNPMSAVFPPQSRAPKYTYYAPQQLRILFQAVQGSMLELPVKLAAYLGLRRSEITGLRWQCVDFQEQIIVIQEVRTAVGGQEVTKLPKTRSSIRKLSFGGARDLMELLQRLHAKAQPAPSAFVLLNAQGNPVSPDALSQALLNVVRKHHLPPITLHGLRHSFASVANSQGATVYDISHALGHSSIVVTSKIYIHLFQQAERRTIQMVAQAIEPEPNNATSPPVCDTGIQADSTS